MYSDSENLTAPFRAHGVEVDSPYLIRAKIPSRHHHNKDYEAFILIDLDKDGTERAVDWFCKCIAGRRTISPCQHALCLISIIGRGFDSPAPADNLDRTFDRDDEAVNEGEDEGSEKEW